MSIRLTKTRMLKTKPTVRLGVNPSATREVMPTKKRFRQKVNRMIPLNMMGAFQTKECAI